MAKKIDFLRAAIFCGTILLCCVRDSSAQDAPSPVFRETGQTLKQLETEPIPQLPEIEEIGVSHNGISFEEIWNLSMRHNPAIQGKANLVDAAQGAQIQAGLYPNPNLNYAGDNLGIDSAAGKHGLGLSQEFVTGRKKQWDRTIAGHDVNAARYEYEMERRKLYNDLRIAFTTMLHAQLTVQIEQYSERLSHELHQGALKRQKNGNMKSVGVLQFQTSLKKSAMQLCLARNDEQAAWRQLVSLVGCTNWPQQQVRGFLTEQHHPKDWDSTWAQLRAESLQLRLAHVKVQQAHANVARQKAERIPNIMSSFSVAQDVGPQNTVPYVSISVPLRIFDKNQGNIQKAMFELAAANREVERISFSLYQELASVFRDYQNADEMVNTYEKEILPDTFKALHQLNDLYHKGEIDYIELYTQRQDVLETLLRYNDALKSRVIAETLIDGMLLQGTLNR